MAMPLILKGYFYVRKNVASVPARFLRAKYDEGHVCSCPQFLWIKMWQSAPRFIKPLNLIRIFFRLKIQQVCSRRLGADDVFFLHKFCGQNCAQRQGSTSSALIYKGKFLLHILQASAGLSCDRCCVRLVPAMLQGYAHKLWKTMCANAGTIA